MLGKHSGELHRAGGAGGADDGMDLAVDKGLAACCAAVGDVVEDRLDVKMGHFHAEKLN